LISKTSKHHPIVFMWCTTYFDILNRLGVNHQCDRLTDVHVYGHNYHSSSVRLTGGFGESVAKLESVANL